ncbi:MAG: hypothetical protein GF398_15955 [Chitinivibrionales bacterium]|nr:hypothetical protein [Chitinivibrionales bacterium]
MRFIKQFVAISLIMHSALLAQVSLTDNQGNSVTVPKERMIVYLFMGHSNMVGRGQGPSSYADTFKTTHPRCWNFHLLDPYTQSAFPGDPHHEFIPAVEPVHQDERNKTTPLQKPVGGGPAMAFMKRMAAQYPGFYFGAIQNADGGLTLRKYKNNQTDGQNPKLRDQILNAAKAIKDKVTIGGVVTMLGGIERANQSAVNSYSSDMKQLADFMRNDLNLPNLPFLITQYNEGGTGSWAINANYVSELMNQINSLEQSGGLSNCKVIPTNWARNQSQYMHDNHHFNFRGQVEWSKYAVQVLQGAGWEPKLTIDTQAPTQPGNVRASATAPMSITLAWNASSDNVGVKEYIVYKNNDSLGATAQQSFKAENLQQCTDYTFHIAAVDFSGNASSKSTAFTSKTDCVNDTEPPSTPANVRVTDKSTRSLTIAWNASQDNTGISGYEVYNGTILVASVNATSATYDGLNPGTPVSLFVVAKDVAGNVSSPGDTLRDTTLSVPVVSLPFKLNCGGQQSGEFASDKQWVQDADYGYTSAGTTQKANTGVVGTNHDVYNSIRMGNFGYKIRVADRGKYTVKLMFAELFGSTSSGDRRFSVTFNGQNASVDPIDIFDAAGKDNAYEVATVIDISTEIIEISVTAKNGESVMSGIVIDQVPAYTLTSPSGGKSFAIGDKITFTWESNEGLVSDAKFFVSPDSGSNWYLLADTLVKPQHATWGNYEWEIAPTVKGASVAGKACVFMITDYDEVYRATTNDFSMISGQSGAGFSQLHRKLPIAPRIMPLPSHKAFAFAFPAGKSYIVNVYTVQGTLLKSINEQRSLGLIDMAEFSANTYVIVLATGKQHIRFKVPLF